MQNEMFHMLHFEMDWVILQSAPGYSQLFYLSSFEKYYNISCTKITNLCIFVASTKNEHFTI